MRACAPTAGRASRTGRWRRSAGASSCSASTFAKLDVRLHANQLEAPDRTHARDLQGGCSPRRVRPWATATRALDTVHRLGHVDGVPRRSSASPRPRTGRGRRRSLPSCRSSRRSPTSARQRRPSPQLLDDEQFGPLVERRGGRLEVMLGYSDSGKDSSSLDGPPGRTIAPRSHSRPWLASARIELTDLPRPRRQRRARRRPDPRRHPRAAARAPAGSHQADRAGRDRLRQARPPRPGAPQPRGRGRRDAVSSAFPAALGNVPPRGPARKSLDGLLFRSMPSPPTARSSGTRTTLRSRSSAAFAPVDGLGGPGARLAARRAVP